MSKSSRTSRLRRHVIAGAGALLLGALSAVAYADGITLRFATQTPDGTAWAREMRAFAREVEAGTNGEVRLKWYWGGVAGDEAAELTRVRRGQLDGMGGSLSCLLLAPSTRVFQVVGLIQNRKEAAYVLGELKPIIDEEYRKSGFVHLATAVTGTNILFSRRPIRSMAEFRAQRWWVWDGLPILRATMPLIGAQTVVSPIEHLTMLYRRGMVDGFIAVPAATLAWQWSTLAEHFTDLNIGILPACLVLSNSAMDPLHIDQQQVIRAAAAKLRVRWNEVNASLEEALIDGLFQKQGLGKETVSAEFRADFSAAARAAMEGLNEELIPAALIAKTKALLVRYRVVRRASAP
jgi:TRAP-type C4-dicarboxylate transport system substrate-binding protein